MGRSDVPPGGSTRPLTDAELVGKLRDCAAGALAPAVIDEVIGLVQSLDTLPDVTALCNALEGAPR